MCCSVSWDARLRAWALAAASKATMIVAGSTLDRRRDRRDAHTFLMYPQHMAPTPDAESFRRSRSGGIRTISRQ